MPIGANSLLMPDYVDSANSGYALGKQQAAQSTLAKYAQGAMGGDQGALAQIYAADPSAGMKIQQASVQAGQQQKQIADSDMQRLAQHSRIITQLYNSGDTEGAQNLYKTIYPEASKILGSNLPGTLDASMIPHMTQLANSIDPQTKKDLINLTPGSTLVDPSTGKPVYSTPAAAKTPQIIQTDQGYATVDPATGIATPVNYAGGAVGASQAPPQTDPMAALIATANQRVQNGEDPEVVQADLVKSAQAAPGVQVGAPGANTNVGMRVMPKKQGGDTPSGYRYQADGATLEPIPGGPADKSSTVNQGLSDDALHNAAWADILTGDSGIKGYGKEATAQRAQIANIKAQIAKDAGVTPQELATTKGRNKALQTSLTKLQTQSDMMQKSEKGFQNNMDQALALSAKLDRSGSPLINKWLLGGKAAIGDPDVAALDAAITTASVDYARIMSGNTGAGGTPISTAEEAKTLLRKELSDKSLNAVADVLHKDIMGQQAAVDSQRQTIMQGMQAFGSQKPEGSSATPPDHDPLGLLK